MGAQAGDAQRREWSESDLVDGAYGEAAMARRTLLLIEDEQSIAEPLQLALEREGFDVVWAATAAAGLEAFGSCGSLRSSFSM